MESRMHRNVHVRFGGGGNGYPVLGARALPNFQANGLLSATLYGNRLKINPGMRGFLLWVIDENVA